MTSIREEEDGEYSPEQLELINHCREITSTERTNAEIKSLLGDVFQWNLSAFLESELNEGSRSIIGEEEVVQHLSTLRQRRIPSHQNNQNPPVQNDSDEPVRESLNCIIQDDESSWSKWAYNQMMKIEPKNHPKLIIKERIKNFNSTFGPGHPPLCALSYNEVVEKAHAECKLMLVYLHSEQHEDTSKFCREIFCTDAFMAFMAQNDNVLVWYGNTMDSEAFLVGQKLGATSFPFLALVTCPARNSVQILYKVVCGASNANLLMPDLCRYLDSAITRGSVMLTDSRAQQFQHSEDNALRQEQDRDFQASLNADQQRETALLEKVKAEAIRLNDEAAAKMILQKAKAEKMILARESIASIGPPPAKNDLNVTFLRLQLFNGSKFDRTFNKDTTTLRHIRDFIQIECHDRFEIEMDQYELVANYPRRVFGPDDLEQTLGEAGLSPQAFLFIQDLQSPK